MSKWTLTFLLLFLLSSSITHDAMAKQTNTQETAKLRVAVASNFSPLLIELLPQFTENTGVKVDVISAASGVIFQQIQHGAPFDVFMSADKERIELLKEKQLIVNNSQATYAIGRLALFSSKHPATALAELSELTEKLTQIKRFAIANPNIAPYGLAAQQALSSYKLWQSLKNKLVQGININQTFQQTNSHAVDYGIVALSQLVALDLKGVEIPFSHYQPIEQQFAILARSKQLHNAKLFHQFILSSIVQSTISTKGYHTAESLKMMKQAS